MDKKTKLFALIGALIVISIAVACAIWTSVERMTDKAEIDFYFINSDGTGIVSEKKTVRYTNDKELVEKAIEELRRGPASSKLGKVIAKDAIVNRVVLDGSGRLLIDLSAEFLDEDTSKNVINTYAVVKTMCSLPKVSTVKVLVDGDAIRNNDGNKLGYISASDINLEAEEYHSEVRQVALYFSDSTKTKLVREMRSIKITDQQPVEQYIINELIKGTDSKSAKSVLSDDTILASIDVEDNICYLNFKSSFLTDNSGEEIHERLVIYSIVNSLTELQTIERVQFYMDGKRIDNFGSVNIKDYISRDTSIISEG